jgi:hypothetical protein
MMFIVRSQGNPKMIYCTDGDFHHETQCGPGGFCAKVCKTERGARAVRGGTVIVERYGSIQARTVTTTDDWGHERVVGGFSDVGGGR